jgi:hypothetical protein
LRHQAKQILKHQCRRDYNFTLGRRQSFWDLALYIKDEDGTADLVRTGFEVRLYRHLKWRIRKPENYRKKLTPNGLFWQTIQTVRRANQRQQRTHRVDVNVMDVLLTAHNVTRLLARPEQWWIQRFPATASGINRYVYDQAAPIFKDLLGQRSADRHPSLHAFWGDSNFDHNRITTRFFSESGPFSFNWSARIADDSWSPAHWNGGMHYYFWVGAIVYEVGDALSASLGGGAVSTRLTYLYELYQKLLTGGQTRANFQLKAGFLAGAEWWKKKKAALGEIRAVAPGRVK